MMMPGPEPTSSTRCKSDSAGASLASHLPGTGTGTDTDTGTGTGTQIHFLERFGNRISGGGNARWGKQRLTAVSFCVKTADWWSGARGWRRVCRCEVCLCRDEQRLSVQD